MIIFTRWRKSVRQNLTAIYNFKKCFAQLRTGRNFINELWIICENLVVNVLLIIEKLSILPLSLETSQGMSACLIPGSPSWYKEAGTLKRSKAVLTDDLLLYVENAKQFPPNSIRFNK